MEQMILPGFQKIMEENDEQEDISGGLDWYADYQYGELGPQPGLSERRDTGGSDDVSDHDWANVRDMA